MLKEKTDKEKAIHRLKIIKGHLNAIENMIENDAYCLDVINQSKAVQHALRNMDMTILENHLKTCVVEQIKNNQDEKTVKELLDLYKAC
jgi:DNA-binding FrmR family transcriptional regulator